jgi:GT2 family glycosyltransferase
MGAVRSCFHSAIPAAPKARFAIRKNRVNLPVVDFVVIARNNRHLIAAALESIARQTIREFTCTLVDGCSSDGTPEFVREHFPWVEVIVKQSDTGPADSRNIGWARGSAAYVAFLDSDVILKPEWAEAQLRFLREDETVGIAGSCLLYSRNPELLYSSHGVMSRYGIAWDGGRAEPAVSFRESRRCLWVNTSALMARRAALEHVDGFDAEMFGAEDADLGWRANLFGWRVVSNPEAVAVHIMHGTLDPAEVKGHLLHLVWRTRLRSAFLNYELRSLVRYTLPFLMLCLADALASSPRKEKWAALLWNLARIRGTLARRRRVQGQRVVRDRDLWHLFQYGFRGPGYGFYPRNFSKEKQPSLGRLVASGGKTAIEQPSPETPLVLSEKRD